MKIEQAVVWRDRLFEALAVPETGKDGQCTIRLTPPQAERIARRLRLPPLNGLPDRNEYDPMRLARWSLPMAAAWITWRSIDAVRRNWSEYARQLRYWHRHRNGGWTPRGVAPPTLKGLFKRELQRIVDEGGEQPLGWTITARRRVRLAQAELWKVLGEEKMEGIGIVSSGQVRSIDAREWHYLTECLPGQSPDAWALASAPTIPVFKHVTVARADVLRLFPVPSKGHARDDPTHVESGQPETTSVGAKLTPMEHKIEDAVSRKWPQGLPVFPTYKERDRAIWEVMKSPGISMPSAVTFRRYFKKLKATDKKT